MRIVAGRLGGRRLVAPKDDATRPTSERVREALFSILASRSAVVGARVVDLYAGTGALGLEALSRGALRATFVESRPKALAALRDNVESLGVASSCRVVAKDVLRALPQLGPGETELLFADPPYADLDDPKTRDALARIALHALTPSGLFVCEHGGKEAPVLEGLALVDARWWGHTGAGLYERPEGGPKVAESDAIV